MQTAFDFSVLPTNELEAQKFIEEYYKLDNDAQFEIEKSYKYYYDEIFDDDVLHNYYNENMQSETFDQMTQEQILDYLKVHNNLECLPHKYLINQTIMYRYLQYIEDTNPIFSNYSYHIIDINVRTIPIVYLIDKKFMIKLIKLGVCIDLFDSLIRDIYFINDTDILYEGVKIKCNVMDCDYCSKFFESIRTYRTRVIKKCRTPELNKHAIKHNPILYTYLKPEEIIAADGIVDICLQSDPEMHHLIFNDGHLPAIYTTRDYILKIIKEGTRLDYIYIQPELHNDRELYLESVKVNPQNLAFVRQFIRDEEFISEAFIDPIAVLLAPNKYITKDRMKKLFTLYTISDIKQFGFYSQLEKKMNYYKQQHFSKKRRMDNIHNLSIIQNDLSIIDKSLINIEFLIIFIRFNYTRQINYNNIDIIKDIIPTNLDNIIKYFSTNIYLLLQNKDIHLDIINYCLKQNKHVLIACQSKDIIKEDDSIDYILYKIINKYWNKEVLRIDSRYKILNSIEYKLLQLYLIRNYKSDSRYIQSSVIDFLQLES